MLLDYAGRAIIQSGIRTPVDLLLYTAYLQRQAEAEEKGAHTDQEQANAISATEAIALGLEGG